MISLKACIYIGFAPILFYYLLHGNTKIRLQSMIGRKMLENQLRRLGIFGAEETISSHPNFDENFKICEHIHYSNFLSLVNVCINCSTCEIWNVLTILFLQCGQIMVMT